MISKFFQKDNYFLGFLLGILLPFVFFTALWLVGKLVLTLAGVNMLARDDYYYLLSMSINLFALKYYFVNLKYEKTGRGILLITLVLTLSYFFLYH